MSSLTEALLSKEAAQRDEAEAREEGDEEQSLLHSVTESPVPILAPRSLSGEESALLRGHVKHRSLHRHETVLVNHEGEDTTENKVEKHDKHTEVHTGKPSVTGTQAGQALQPRRQIPGGSRLSQPPPTSNRPAVMSQNARAVAKALPVGVASSAAALGTKGLNIAAQPKARQRPPPRHTVVSLPQGSPPVFAPRIGDQLGLGQAGESANVSHKEHGPMLQGRTAFTFEEFLGQEPQFGRIGAFSMAEKLDIKKLSPMIKSPNKLQVCRGVFTSVADVSWNGDSLHIVCQPRGHIFLFEWGVAVLWGFNTFEEKEVMTNLIKPISVGPEAESNVEIEDFEFRYTGTSKPNIANDCITLDVRNASNHGLKQAISYALAQSTKLGTFEERIADIIEGTIELPKQLAATGKVKMGRKDMSKLIGRVFLEKCAVNLLSSVLETPDYFWDAPDSLQKMYDGVCEYLDMEERIELLNARFEVLQAMLDILRDHQNTEHSSYLEWIVIALIVIEVIIGIFEVMGVFGWIGKERTA
mmetsp:Transcript_3489/g.12587  ORF Transcript_3489/g.12587 Transcript_3489/m.12587 type:complete len:528 (-) Transcript_3489:156-1739(-)|eukprot:scaffold2631_cov412-Prasinococcus_capsulatus_cf.AAC.10